MWQQIKRDINAVLARDPAARSAWEVVLCYPGFHALLMHRVSSKLWEWKFHLTARWLSSFGRFFTGVDIHPAAHVGEGFFIDHATGVVIGETVTIGSNVTLYQGVTLGGVSLKKEVRHPQIGNDVVIGAGAKLLGPIIVGDGARIGSNSVVVEDVAAMTTVVGVPAHEVSVRKSKTGLKTDEGFSEVLFEAYGTPCDKPADPVLEELMQLKREVAALKKKVKAS